MEIFKTNSPQDFMKVCFLRIKQRNPQFSEVALAKKLNFSQSYINLILSNKRRPGAKIINAFKEKILTSPVEQNYLECLREISASKHESDYKRALREFHLFKLNSGIGVSEISSYDVIAHWECSAILEFFQLQSSASTKEIADFFQWSSPTTIKFLHMLRKVRYVKQVRGKWQRSHMIPLRTSDQISNQALREFHSKILGLAIQAIQNQDLNQRNIQGITMAIDPKKIPQAKIKIKKFMREIMNFLEDGTPTNIYQFNTILFRLNPKEEK